MNINSMSSFWGLCFFILGPFYATAEGNYCFILSRFATTLFQAKVKINTQLNTLSLAFDFKYFFVYIVCTFLVQTYNSS